MGLKIKICGITSADDALAAVAAGADALGFVFFEASPRKMTATDAARIIWTLPPFVAKVGVFVNAPEDVVRKTIEDCGLDTLQFHGEETPEYCRKFHLKTIKAFRIRDKRSLRSLTAYNTDAWLLDSFVHGKPGGTGHKFSWHLVGGRNKLGRPIILAGGLTPHNVKLAIKEARPYGVDVSSGVESVAGKKDYEKMREFVTAARAADSALSEPTAPKG